MTMERDPVCGMDIPRENAEARTDYQGHTYYFCSLACQGQFTKTPDRYTREHTPAR